MAVGYSHSSSSAMASIRPSVVRETDEPYSQGNWRKYKVENNKSGPIL